MVASLASRWACRGKWGVDRRRRYFTFPTPGCHAKVTSLRDFFVTLSLFRLDEHSGASGRLLEFAFHIRFVISSKILTSFYLCTGCVKTPDQLVAPITSVSQQFPS